MTLRASVDSRTLVTQIADTLRAAVMTGELKPGQRMRQEEFSSQLGVSRTPLREAFRVLENGGWLISRPRLGFEVASLSAAQAEELAVMRLLLEPFATRIASEAHDESEEARVDELLARTSQPLGELNDMAVIDEANRGLHFHLYGMSSELITPALSTTILQHWERFSRYRQIYWAIDGQVLTRSIPDHERIVSAWKRRDADAAEREVARHILEAVVALIRRLDPGVSVSPALAHMASRYDLEVDL